MIRELTNTETGEVFQTDPHQLEAYEFLMTHPRAALFLGMSLSKTAITLSYLYEMHYREVAIRRTLVIAPDKVARITWPEESKKWEHLDGLRMIVISGDENERIEAINRKAEVYVIGVNNVAWLIKTCKGLKRFDSLVIDELSLFKSRGSKRFKMLRNAIKHIDYRVGLTGTPAPNGYIDLWAQMYLIDGGERLGVTFGAYLDKYFKTRGNGMIVFEYIPKLNAEKIIANKIKDITLSMQTRDILELPALHMNDEILEFSPFDKEIYNTLEREYCLDLLNGSEVTVKTGADLTNKLLQLSSGAVYEDGGAKEWYELNTLKIEALRVLLRMYPDENFILVYQYRHEIARIKAAFPFAQVLRKGKGTVEDFTLWNQGKIKLLMIHPAGAGHGLNLQFGGRRMVWFSVTWNLEHWLQTIARLLRRGALRDIYVHRLLVNGTRDMAVCKRVKSKDTNQTFLLNEIKLLRERYKQR